MAGVLMARRTLPAGSEAPETLLLSPLAGRGPPTPGHTGSGALESGLEGADVSNCFSLSALSISKFSAGLPSASDPHLPSLLCVCVAGGHALYTLKSCGLAWTLQRCAGVTARPAAAREPNRQELSAQAAVQGRDGGRPAVLGRRKPHACYLQHARDFRGHC